MASHSLKLEMPIPYGTGNLGVIGKELETGG